MFWKWAQTVSDDFYYFVGFFSCMCNIKKSQYMDIFSIFLKITTRYGIITLLLSNCFKQTRFEKIKFNPYNSSIGEFGKVDIPITFIKELVMKCTVFKFKRVFSDGYDDN